MRFFKSSQKRAFPLPNDFFTSVSLCEHEVQMYRARMETFLKESLETFANYQDQLYKYEAFHGPWKMVASTRDVKAFVHQHNEQHAMVESRVIGRLELDYRDFLRCLYADTRSDFAKVEKQLFNMTLDAFVLQTIESHKPHSFFGIKWAAYNSFAPQYRLNQQDACFLEFSGFTLDLNGREVGYILQVPVKRLECPDLFEKKLLVRFERTTALLVAPLNGDMHCCRVFMTGHYNFSNSATTVPYPYFREQVEGFDRVVRLCQSMQSPTTLLFIRRGRPSHHNSNRHRLANCLMCHRHFHAFRARHNCLLCGETICRSCFVVLTDVCSPDTNYFGKKKFKICMHCCNGTTQKELPEWLTSCDALTESTDPSFGSFRSNLYGSFNIVNSQLHSEAFFASTSDTLSMSTDPETSSSSTLTFLNSALLSSEQRKLLKKTSLSQKLAPSDELNDVKYEHGNALDEMDLLEAEEIDDLHELDVIVDVDEEHKEHGGGDDHDEVKEGDGEGAMIVGDAQDDNDLVDVMNAFPLVMSFHRPVLKSDEDESLHMGQEP